MDERPDQDREKSSGENAEPAAVKGSPAAGEGAASSGAANDLPKVESPKLADGEGAEESAERAGHGGPHGKTTGALPVLFGEYVKEAPSEPAAASDPQPRSFRFVLLAATIACAAGIGALAGSLSATGIAHRSVAAAPIGKTADARDVVQALKAQVAELSSLKADLDNANRSAGAQFAKIADRLNSIEHAQADPASKLAHIADAVDRLDKRAAPTPEVTGSIAANPPAAAAAVPDANLPIVRNWEVEEVHAGRALVESRYGSEFLVGPGSTLPGLGHVQEVKRQGGQWIVITEKGKITSRGY